MDRLIRYEEVIRVIDSVMNNREIDSIRDAILAIRDEVKKIPEDAEIFHSTVVRIPLATNNQLYCTSPWADGNQYVCIAPMAKIDGGQRGEYWYE